MRKNFGFSRFVCFILLLVIVSIVMTACGGQTVIISSGGASYQTVANVDHVPSSPTAVALNISSQDPSSSASPSPTTVPVQAEPVSWSNPVTMYTVGDANLRSAPSTSGAIVQQLTAGQELTVYGTVNGEILSDGPTWYRVSDQNSAPQYIYNDLITSNKPVPVDNGAGKIIKVDLTTQHIYAYENGVVVHDNLVSSGQPGLLTPTGTFSIISKLSPATFYSPWPKSSPYYYAPLHINYALGFQGTLLFLHDAYWRGNDFGPGTNVPHAAANGTQMTGSHGCVEMSTADAGWFYNWASIGTPLIIYYE